jgi:transcriptional regulator with GAF, ATPase, and Fis domain
MSREVDRGAIVGRSDLMQEVFRLVEQVAPARSTVLITGESGTGKELIAKAIHESSPRANRSFVTVNSSNIPSELLESELFGHTRGAFTGAVAARKVCSRSLMAVQFSSMRLAIFRRRTQVRLLRVIQEREFTPLGDTTPRRVDVRIIAATNIDLKEAVRQGVFREDLYYRLAVVPIELPPCAIAARTFCRWRSTLFASTTKRTAGRCLSTSTRVLLLLENYSWPGNVRELENTIERAVVIAPDDEITKECLRREIADPQAAAAVARDAAGTSSAST